MTQYTQHPCIETTTGQPRLKIFQYFYKELTLPKYMKERSSSIDTDTSSLLDSMSVNASTPFQSSSDAWNNERYIVSVTKSAKKKIFDKIVDLFIERQKDPVETTFDKIKNAKGALSDDMQAMIEVITKLANRAAKNGQTALVEELKKKLNAVACELTLVKNGYLEYVSEEKMIEFFLKCKKGVRIDFIRNYTGLIPFPVAEKKDKVDQLMVFDNYCIVHYDPNLEAFRVADLDRAVIKKRDPILFGMIEGSRRLYYVADWVTDTDSLTLEQLNLVVDNATSRLKKFQDTMPTPEDIMHVIQNIEPIR